MSPDAPPARADLRPFLAPGLGLFALVATLLALGGVALLDAVYLGALLVLLPVLTIAQERALDEVVIERIPAYGGSVVALMILTGATITVGAWDGGLEALGLVPMPIGAVAAWAVLLVILALATILAFRWAAARLGATEHPVLRELIPRTGREKGVFAILSGWAGVGEELTYRGYAILTLAPLLGTVGGAVVTSAVFGVLHAYQGVLGILRSGVMGGVLAWGFLACGSLWPPIVAHALVDVVVGLFLADRLMVPERAAGVGGGEGPAGPRPS